MALVLIIDGANVVGARPDGWWKDRPGAAARLHHALLTADVPGDRVVLILEGHAKQGVRAGRDAHLETVHAARDGDATILATARSAAEGGAQVKVVTADRALAARLASVGASTLSPTWLLERL